MTERFDFLVIGSGAAGLSFALEIAAHDGRLEKVRGVGPRRAAAIRASLASLLGRRPRLRSIATPDVSTLLRWIGATARRRALAGCR